MKVLLYRYFLLLTFFFFHLIHADPMIIEQLHEPPASLVESVVKTYAQEQFKKKEQKIAQAPLTSLSRKLFKDYVAMHTLFRCEGILGLYSGYCMYSDRSGFLTFPLRHSPPNQLFLVICSAVDLQPIAQNTIGYLKLHDASTPYVSYLFEKRQDSSKQWFWSVQKTTEAVNAEGIISNKALILHTKPSTFIVQEGDFPAFEGSNIIVPPAVFVVQNKENARRLARTVDILRYFEPITFEKTKPIPTVEQKIMKNV